MRKTVGLAAVAVLFIAGCGADLDAIVKQSVECWDEAATIMETISDRSSALDADVKLKMVLNRMNALNEQARKQELGPVELAQIERDNKPASERALQRFNAATRKAANVPEGVRVVAWFTRAARP